MKNAPGYPLPSGELGSDDIVCQLVYLPDRSEYWQAFYAALHYMTTWRAWERDDDKRGKDAASNWRTAFEMTSECWRMACLEQLQDDVAAILAIMQIPQSCCDPGDVTDGDQYTDRVEDGEGDVPQNIIDAGYAEDAADWDGFDDYKCMIAHVITDQLVGRLNEISPLVSATGGVLGGVAALAGILAVIFGTGGLAIVFGIVAGIGATSLLYQAITDFDIVDGLADKVTTNHDALACAVYFADGDASALIALNDKIDELFTSVEALILKNLNLGPTLKALYAGRYDQQDIAEILDDAGYDVGDFDCACDEQIGEFAYSENFDTGYGILTNQGSAWSRDPTGGNPGWTFWRQGGSGWFFLYVTGGQLAVWAGGLSTQSVKIKKVGVDYWNVSGAGMVSLEVAHAGVGSPYVYDSSRIQDSSWHTLLGNLWYLGFDEITEHDHQVRIMFYYNGAGQINADNVYIEFDLLP